MASVRFSTGVITTVVWRYWAVPAVLVTAVATVAAVPQAVGVQTAQPPNIIVFLTDDQPKGTLDAMPNVLSRIQQRGLNFTNGVIPTSLCCPSRTSLLTGYQSHTTGVYTNEPPFGGWPTFHDGGWESKDLPVALDDAGYRTGLFGKYLNEFQAFRPDGYVPPGWDVFRALLPTNGNDGSYYDYQITGVDGQYGDAPRDYSTDVLGQLATDFVADPSKDPYFLYFAPYAPHPPMEPAPRDKHSWPLVPRSDIPALNEAIVADKPTWVQRPKVDGLEQRRLLTRQHESLMAVDDWVGTILEVADLSNTLVIFLSDNGLMLGSHRLTGKSLPYLAASEVPMMVRWDGHISPGRTDRVTPQIDLTALIRDASGVSLPMEGVNPLALRRRGVVLEQTNFKDNPAYCGWRSKRYLYVHYTAGQGEEFYDYTVDPEELRNAVGKEEYATKVAALRSKAQNRCSPAPPGFDW